ncbi:50S ribosomal protein L25/general stress protein Ctc [Bacillus sp. FJAT-45350]|uniref:50S ribosomal protein L25/general stress protein Ctc n=1 Tax=Bacillus sp. FJAT-45350 TaxID=2011014 RepID=UPI000BB78263|nr:50S ribosomal protein L25/general stress protein Ctc [Bacillus sp. FJAT-45350]
MTATLQAKRRPDMKNSTTREFRLNGQVPAILYGKKTESKPIAVDSIEFLKTIRENGRNGIISLSVDSDNERHQVIVNEWQTDPLKGEFLHIDFFEVDMKSEMDAEVPVRLDGDAPGAKDGGIVSQLMHSISVRCLPTDIPEEVVVDISNLNIGDSIQIRDMVNTQKVDITNDPEETIVTVLVASAEKEPEQQPEGEAVEAEQEAEAD